MCAQSSSLSVRDVPRAAGPEHAPGISPVFRRLGIVETKAFYRYEPHQHWNYEVIFVDRGTYRCRLNDAELVMEPAGVLVVKPGDWHADACVPPLRYFGVTFTLSGQLPDGSPPALFAPSVRPGQQCFRADRKALWPILDRLEREAAQPDGFSSHVQDALLLELFWRLVRALPREALSPEFLDFSIERGSRNAFLRLFETRLHRNLSVGEMARALHMSERLLNERSREILGAPPARAYLRFKVERARVLLTQTSMSIKEIGAYLGFKDQYHFSKAFKRVLGAPPSRCRAKRA